MNILGVHRHHHDPLLKQYLINTREWPVGLYTFKIVIPKLDYSINGKFEVLH